MEHQDRRTAELAALEAHRRAAQNASGDPATVFRLATFTNSMAQELLVESIEAYRKVKLELESRGDRSEAWERASAMIIINYLFLGNAAAARAALESLLQEKPASASGFAAAAELYHREGRAADAVRALDEAAKLGGADHPLVAAIRNARA
ncbi:MAG: hypothetical protein ACKVS6_05420 [Planctomycetota bacterium]